METNDRFEIGQLSARVENLTRELYLLREQLDKIGNSIEDIKIWRAQIMATSAAASGFVSIVCYFAEKMLRHKFGE